MKIATCRGTKSQDIRFVVVVKERPRIPAVGEGVTEGDLVEEVDEESLPLQTINVRKVFGENYGNHNAAVDASRQGALIHAVLEDYVPVCCTETMTNVDPPDRQIISPVLYSFELSEVTCPECLLEVARDMDSN